MRKAKAQEDRARLLVESMPHAIVIVDEGGTITEVNSQTLRWFGYERGEMIGRPVEMLIPERLRGAHAGLRAGFAADPGVRPMGTGRELFALRRDGSEFPVDISLSPIQTERGLEVIAAIADVTDRRRIEGALRETHERYLDVIRTLPVGITIFREFEPLLINDHFAHMLGYESPAEFVTASAQLGHGFFVPEEHRQDRLKVHREGLDGGPLPSPIEWDVLHKDGTRIWLETWRKRVTWSDLRPAIQSAHVDITERKQAELIVRESERRFRTLVESLPHALVIVDDRGRITEVNSQACAWFQYEKEALLGKAVEMLLPERNRPHHLTLRQDFMSQPSLRPMGTGRELYGLRRDGTEFPVDISLSPIRTERGLEVIASVADMTERKRTEAIVRENERRFRTLVESLPHALVIVDEQARITEINSQTLSWFGYEKAELVGQPVELLLPERNREHHVSLRDHYIASPALRPMGTGRELFGRRKDGTEFPVDISLSPIRTERGLEVIASIADITDRKRMESELRESHDRYKALIRTLPVGVMVHRDFEPLLVNLRFAEMLGYHSPEEFLADTQRLGPGFYIPEATREQRMSLHRRRMAGEVLPSPIEWETVHKDGTRIWLESWLKVVYWDDLAPAMESVHVDITERRLARAMLQQSEESFRAIFERAPVAMAQMDRRMVFTRANKGFADLTGYTVEQLTGMSAYVVTPPEDRPKIERFAELLFSGQVPETRDVRRVLKTDGTIAFTEATRSVLSDSTGAQTILIMLVDITERIRAEAALRQSEETFRAIFENAPVSIFSYGRDLRITRANRRYLDMMEYGEGELLGVSAIDLIAPEERAAATALAHQLLDGKGPGGPILRKLATRSGKAIQAQVTRSLITDKDGNPSAVVMLVDMTERLRAEAALRQSEEAFRTIFENAPVGIVSFGSDLKFTRVNRRFAGMVEYSQDELIGTPPADLIVEEDRPAAVAFAHKVFEGDVSATPMLRRLRTKSGKIVHTETTRSVIVGNDGNASLVAMVVDITERLRAEAALRESSERFQRVFDDGPVPMTIVDRDLRFIRINQQFCRMLGYDAIELEGKRVGDVTHPEDFEQEARLARELFDGKSDEMRLEKRFISKPGGIRIAALTRSVLRESSDARRYAISIIEDITERKHAEEELVNANRALGAANRELESFAYSVSHDLRQPLRAMSGFSHALAEDYRDRMDDTGKDYLLRIERAVTRMTQLIDDMLTLSRVTRAELTRRPVDLTEMCWSIIEELRTGGEPRQVDVRIQPDLNVSADPAQLHTLLRNLLGNAWKFSGKSAQARIEVGQETLDGETVLFVRDNGVGFDMKYAGQLFAPFQRLHAASEFPGTGIGLAIVQRVAAKHGGRVWADSKPGEGTTIRFTL